MIQTRVAAMPRPQEYLAHLQVLVIGSNHNWAIADTLEEAIAKAGKPREYIAYVAAPGTKVSEVGYLMYQQGYAPKVIARKTAKK